MRSTSRLLPLLAVVLLNAGLAMAQWTTQTISLRPGWNAVHLEVQPEPGDCDTAFARFPIESAWMWNRRHVPVQFIQDTNTLVPGNPDWLAYLPPTHPSADQTSLFRLLGGKCYMIKMPNTGAPMNWVILGRPVVAPAVWVTDSFNLAGFSVDAQSPPTYAAFFGPSAAHKNSTIYRLRIDGYWEPVPLPSINPMSSGRAIWLRCQGFSTYQGPIQIVLEQSTGLPFGRVLNEQTLVIRNASTATQSLVVRQLPSSTPPADPAFPPLAGEVPLAYWYSSESAPGHWTNLPATLTRSGMAAGAEWRLRLAVRRQDMTPPPSNGGGLEPLYQSLLEVTSSPGSSRHLIPVSAYGIQRSPSAQPSFAGARAQSSSSDVLHAGLWIGSAVIDKVNQPALAGNPDTPLPAKYEFQFRLILHVDGSGKARLLQKVIQMWKDGTYKPDPDDPGKTIVDEPGRFVLLTDETLASAYSGAALRDGQPVGRRFSTAAFGFPQPLPMTRIGEFGADGSILECTNLLDYRDPLNPFVHRYHPDHDNLNGSYMTTLEPGMESPTITRAIALEFTAEDPDNLQLAGWGSSQLGGHYRETITGLHQVPLRVQGTFRIHLASSVTQLNDGLLP